MDNIIIINIVNFYSIVVVCAFYNFVCCWVYLYVGMIFFPVVVYDSIFFYNFVLVNRNDSSFMLEHFKIASVVGLDKPNLVTILIYKHKEML